jgi:hypothetical protein
LGSRDNISASFSTDIWTDIEKVTDLENNCLTSPFNLDEIHRAVFDMDASKAPCSDGFLMLFYQHYWT